MMKQAAENRFTPIALPKVRLAIDAGIKDAISAHFVVDYGDKLIALPLHLPAYIFIFAAYYFSRAA